MCMEYFLAYLLDDLAQAVPCKRKRVSKENRDDLKVDKERNLGKEKPSSLAGSRDDQTPGDAKAEDRLPRRVTLVQIT
ncbi:hypothetical protein D6C85_04662 [Aureobasidium pullulans]|uniref:Uncharacterized protein n=1 Tax=Aureobasidium pullulans TaxID=5580 RepID=A0A4S9X2N2_AURPU|nr:hypothetical protein D6D22_04295 [Aureobasidium pullulans]THZ72501.1 hypothetical protein D6C85_04662 [Aureobasidium pullulans]